MASVVENTTRKRRNNEPTSGSPAAKQQKHPPEDPATARGTLPDTQKAINMQHKMYTIILVVNIPTPVEKDYLIDSTIALNEWLHAVQDQDNEAGLVRWETTNPTKILREMPLQVTEWLNHVHGFNASNERGETHHWKVNLALASSTKVEDVMTELGKWEDKSRLWAKLADDAPSGDPRSDVISSDGSPSNDSSSEASFWV